MYNIYIIDWFWLYNTALLARNLVTLQEPYKVTRDSPFGLEHTQINLI
jgi:hypothetical protein